MPEATNEIAKLIVDSVKQNQSASQRVQLDVWANLAEPNRALVEALTNLQERNNRLTRFECADAEAIWNNLRARARSESGYEPGVLPVPIVPVSRALKTVLITIAIFAVLSIVTVF